MGARKLWTVALGIWFLLYAVLAVTNIRFDFQGTVMGVLAAVVAVLIFIDR